MALDIVAVAVVVVTVLFIGWIDRHPHKWVQRVLTWFPAMLLAYLIPAGITHLFSLDLSGVWVHRVSRNAVIPIAIVTLMSALPVGRLLKVGWKPIVLFLTGSLIIAVLPAALVAAASLSSTKVNDLFVAQGYWKGLVPIVGGWIGGSTSQLVLKEVVECPNELFLSVIVIDNLLVNIWTLLMFQAIRFSDKVNAFLNIKASPPEDIEAMAASNKKQQAVTAISLVFSTWLVTWLIDDFVSRVAVLSVVGLILGNGIPGWSHSLTVKVGGIFILVIMSILGLRLDFTRLNLPAAFVMVCITWLVLHYLLMLLVAWLLRVHMAWLPISSMANLGGISTAPAVTAAYNRNWMPHAVLLAVLSMVTGNLWGFLTIYLFHVLGG